MKMLAWVLVCCVALCGCGQPAPVVKEVKAVAVKAESDHGDDHDHEDHHAHTAKYGGALVEVGDHVGQMEFLLDKATGKLTVYAMDGHAENPVRMAWTEFKFEVRVGEAAPVAVVATPVASALTGETVGDTAQFEAVVDVLKGVDAFEVFLPPFEYRGVQLEASSFKYPEGTQ